jgi:hypothetical protein
MGTEIIAAVISAVGTLLGVWFHFWLDRREKKREQAQETRPKPLQRTREETWLEPEQFESSPIQTRVQRKREFNSRRAFLSSWLMGFILVSAVWFYITVTGSAWNLIVGARQDQIVYIVLAVGAVYLGFVLPISLVLGFLFWLVRLAIQR